MADNAGSKVELYTSQWDSAYEGVIADAARIDEALDGLGGTVSVDVEVDDSQLTDLDTLDVSVIATLEIVILS